MPKKKRAPEKTSQSKTRSGASKPIKNSHSADSVVTFLDTDALKVHDELMDKELRYRALIAAKLAVVWEVDKSGEFLDGIASWCAYTGQDPLDVKGLGWLNTVGEDEREQCQKLWVKGLGEGKPFKFATKVWSQAHNTYHYVYLEGIPHSESTSKETKWICSLTDINTEKRFDEKFRFAVQASPYAVLIVDAKGVINFVNEATHKLVGYEESDLLGQAIEILVPAGSRERHARFRELYIQDPSARLMASGIEIFVVAKSGKQLPVEVRLSPIHTDAGINILCSISDISLRIQAEEILQRSTEELELRVFERTHDLVEANTKLIESEKKYSLLYEDAPDMYASVSPKDGEILQCNTTLVKALGYKDKGEILGRSVLSLYAEESYAVARRCFNKFTKTGSVDNTELRLLKKDGSTLPVMLKVNAVRDDRGEILYSLSSWRDISIKKALEKEKRTTLELDLIYRSTEIISETQDLSEALQKCIEMICKITRFPVGHVFFPDDNNKLVPSSIWSLKYPRKLKRFKKVMDDTIFKRGTGLTGRILESEKAAWIKDIYQDDNFPRAKVFKEFNVRAALGFPIIVYNKVIAVCEFFSFESEAIDKYLINILQVVGEQVGRVLERNQVEQQLESLAHYDVITGLPNRAYFNEVLERFLSRAKRKKSALALLYLDIDNFKKVNDILGHSVGDRLLEKVALEIKRLIRDEDFIGRMGGDEFVVLMDDIDSYKDAVLLARKVLERLAKPFYIDKHEINTSVSIGIALYPDGSNSAESIQKNADIAMFRAKDKGKNTFQFYSVEINDAYQRQAIIERQLHHAIRNKELYLVYQPQISLETGKIYGLEALIRWKNNKLGEVSPMEFIPIAEDIGLITSIGEWVLTESCKQFKFWETQYKSELDENPLVLSINVSVLQLIQEYMVEHVRSTIEMLQINPESLILEITETALMLNIDHSVKALTELHDIGVGIAIDDFGTGYSSLSYLKQLPFTTLKIDQSFVQDVTKDQNDASIVKAIIQLGSVMDLDILAEGVETKAQLNFLKKVGCHYAQGYYFDKPLSPEDFARLIQEHRVY